MTVYINCNKGELVGQQDDVWLVDTGSAIMKSKYEPVTHAIPEGWYMKGAKPVYVTHYTAWARDGRLIPVYRYTDHSAPPFGSDCLYETELAKMSPCENPYLSESEIQQIKDSFDEALYPLESAVASAKKALDAVLKERAEALKKCKHQWEKDGDEEEGRKGMMGTEFSQGWACACCGKEYRQSYTRLG